MTVVKTSQKATFSRIQWTEKYATSRTIDLRSKIFYNESKFNLFGFHRKAGVKHRSGERFSKNCVRRTFKQGHSQMIWECFTYHGIEKLTLTEIFWRTFNFIRGSILKKMTRFQNIESCEGFSLQTGQCVQFFAHNLIGNQNNSNEI